MPDTRAKLLIVDDEPSIRSSMALVLTEIGYHVRSARDGFSALAELRNEIPDVLLSDLNMPGMSGFELLSVVRRRFPSIPTIAMSGAFSGDEVPSGVAADAFYQKGSSLGSLLRILEDLPRPERALPNHSAVPVWTQLAERDSSGVACVTITCPECLRTFSQAPGCSAEQFHEANCVHCHGSIRYAISDPAVQAAAMALERTRDEGQPRQFAAAPYCD